MIDAAICAGWLIFTYVGILKLLKLPVSVPQMLSLLF